MMTAATAPATPRTDAELIARCREGDRAAMEALMRRHNRTLYRTTRAILRDDAEAEDAVQEAYLQAFRALATFREDSSFRTWLTRIAANQALMRRRRQVRHAQVFTLDGIPAEDILPEAPMTEPGPERAAMIGQTREVLERRIDALPDMYRSVFVLRAVEELTVEETATILDLPEATVRTRFFRARGLLRAALANDMDHALEEVFGFAGARCDRIVAGVLAALPAKGG
ncbi:MAG TPA: RNA polymerase sigma factor [Usitatibacter sp.]|nr:RNA polymerase sigma factor [Usitatibacter sp.]